MKRMTITAVMAMLALLSATAQTAIEITYNGTSATVSIPDDVEGVTSVVNGANVTILSTTTATEYTYRVSGTSADGSLVINGNYKLTLQLAGLQLTNAHGGAVIDVECGKRIAVELVDKTVNTLADVAGSQKAALYFKGHPEFEGSGTLNITGNAKHAIAAKEYLELKSSTGIINVLGAVSDGIHCGKAKVNDENNYFLMKGGMVNIRNVGGDGIDSDDYGVLSILGGSVSLNVGDGATGLKADSTVTIGDALVNIVVTGTDSEGIRARHTVNINGGKTTILVTGNGSKGIKGKRYTSADAGATVVDGGYVNISGGETIIHALAANYIDVLTGDTAKCIGISTDADFTQSGGSIALTAMGAEAKPYNVKGNEMRTGGTLTVNRSPWQSNVYDYQYDMTAYIAVSRDGTPLIDYSNVAVGAFIGSQCVGSALFTSAGFGTLRVRSNSTAAQGVTFRLHDYTTGQTYSLTPSQNVTFQPDTSIGQPSAPLMLSYTGALKGDVNGDGIVNVTDITLIINHILKKGSDNFNEEAADVNGDGTINVTDVTLAINIILRK